VIVLGKDELLMFNVQEDRLQPHHFLFA
jgi:hypothetical protein